MELRDFAERIVFATTLEEKLQWVDALKDDAPGAPLAAPEMPGRPTSLRFRPQTSARSDFPSVQRLGQERERGRLLHFLGNHELLATELMALVLLKFPDAPGAFRRGVLNTLRDEQIHTRLYMERMKACGVEFGELPVSGFFWRCAASMENPVDYVATLCLTFEQANLDFARHFSEAFAHVGDAESARLLDRIYHDEIGHVAYGLRWFRRWKRPDESDWDAFCRTLKFPLSPQRAKGFSVNVEGRRAAGFDAAFIDALNVFSQSRGRTPSVYVFNPFAEAHLGQRNRFEPTKAQRQFAADLANLPQFLGRQDDVVLVPQRPALEFLSRVRQAGFPLPEFVELPGGRIDPGSGLAQRKLGRLRPWAWGPDSAELLAPLYGNVTGETRSSEHRFGPEIAQLYSKAWSSGFLSRLLDQEVPGSGPGGRGARWVDERWLCTPLEVGVTVTTMDAALEAIAAIRARGHHRVVVKQAFGLAGQNAIRLWESEVQESQRGWLAHAEQNGCQMVVEPWLEREMDFSAQLEMGADGLKLRGYTGLSIDRKGHYQGNWAESHHHRRIPAGAVALFREPADIASRLHQLYGALYARLEPELERAHYVGPVGIDAFVFRSAQGDCRLKPVVEINPRYTMGRLTVELMQRTCPGSWGRLRLISRPAVRTEGYADFETYARSLSEQFPLRLEGQPQPRIWEGALCLNDPARAQICLAVFEVSRNSKVTC